MLDLFAKLGNIKEAVHIFKEIRRNGMPLDRVVYSSLMEAFLVSGNPSAALSIHEEMISKVKNDDRASYLLALRCYAELGDLKTTKRIWEVSLGFNHRLDRPLLGAVFSLISSRPPPSTLTPMTALLLLLLLLLLLPLLLLLLLLLLQEMHTSGMDPGPTARGEYLRAAIRAG